jgi:uncharacterized protein with HEPN domain
MSKDDSVYVGHMLDLTKKIIDKTSGLARRDYDSNEDLRLALTHLIQTIGEAARRVSPEFRELHAQVPWKAIVGMRHKVVHDYMNVDEDVVWDTAVHEIPALFDLLAKILPREA